MERIGDTVPAIAAHRGWHADGAPENSLAALDRAIEGGADWVETDVRRLGDGTIVVYHDADLPNGTPLKSLDRSMLAGHPHVPTLEDWSAKLGASRAGALVEFKERGYEAESLEVLHRNIVKERLNVMSFDHDAVRSLRALEPDLPVGLLSDGPPVVDGIHRLHDPETLIADARRAGASFVGLNVGQAEETTLAAAHRAGMGVAVWTVDDAADLSRLLGDSRVSTVISDLPALAQQLRPHVPMSVAVPGGGAAAGVRLLRAVATMR